jgi:hypothetical protein
MTLLAISLQYESISITPFRCFVWCIIVLWLWIIIQQIRKPWLILRMAQRRYARWGVALLIVSLFLVLGSVFRDRRPDTPKVANNSNSAIEERATNIQHNEGDNNININNADAVTINPPAKTETEWILMPANEPDPFKVRAEVPPDALKIFLGNNVAYVRKMGLHKILEIGGTEIIAINRTPKGLFISAHIWREDGREVATIKENQFTYNHNNYYLRLPEMPNQHELQVFGKSGDLIWTVRYINEQSVVFHGTFCAPNHAPVVVTENKLQLGNFSAVLSGNTIEERLDPNDCIFVVE